MSVTIGHDRHQPTTASGSQSFGHISGIDGLRAIAVLMVIIFHFAAPLLPGGFVGVDVFFVISGHVVTASLLRTRIQGRKSFFVGFYARRLLRIYPALIACALTTALAYTLLVPQAHISQTNAKTGLAAFFGLSNFALIMFDDGYFSPRVDYNAFTHTWSLAVEEQFYLVFPVLLWMYLVSQARGSRASIWSGISILAVTALSFACAAWDSSTSPTRAYYLLPSRFWELGVGAILAMAQGHGMWSDFRRTSANIMTSAGLIGILISACVTEKSGFPYPGAIFPVLASALVIVGVTSGRSDISRYLLENSAVTYVGRLSYSLYLWHWPVIVLLRWTVGADLMSSLVAAAGVTMILAMASHHLVENPVRNSKVLLALPRSTILAGGVAVVVLSAVLAAGVFAARSTIALTITKRADIWQSDTRWNAMPPSRLPGRSTLYLLGDSHAWTYSDLAAMLHHDGLANVSRHVVLGCSSATLRKPATPDCARKTESAVKSIIAQAKPGDVVLLGALRTPRIGDQWISFDRNEVLADQSSPRAHEERKLAFVQAEKIINDFRSAGIAVIMDAPKPVFPAPAFRCSDWFNRGNPICAPGLTVEKEYLMQLREPVMKSLAAMKEKYPDVIVWDTFDVLCPGDSCSAMDGAYPLFFDGDHLSGYGIRKIYPHFMQMVRQHTLFAEQ